MLTAKISYAYRMKKRFLLIGLLFSPSLMATTLGDIANTNVTPPVSPMRFDNPKPIRALNGSDFQLVQPIDPMNSRQRPVALQQQNAAQFCKSMVTPSQKRQIEQSRYVTYVVFNPIPRSTYFCIKALNLNYQMPVADNLTIEEMNQLRMLVGIASNHPP